MGKSSKAPKTPKPKPAFPGAAKPFTSKSKGKKG